MPGDHTRTSTRLTHANDIALACQSYFQQESERKGVEYHWRLSAALSEKQLQREAGLGAAGQGLP